MNRLSPLIVRRSAAAVPIQLGWTGETDERDPDYLDDLKLVATGWLGGFVFFLTFLS